MKLANAKLKPIEQMPPEFLCCEQKKAFISQHRDIIVKVKLGQTTIRQEGLWKCPYCGKTTPSGIDIMIQPLKNKDNANTNFAFLEIIDIDEGSYDV